MTDLHPDYADPERRAALYQLLDRTWSGIADKLQVAADYGWHWPAITTPFARFDGQRAISHVGVLDLPVRLNDTDTSIAGIHAVCTDTAYRRQGHFRALMTQALEYVDEHWQTSKLSTDQPHLYEPFGFRVIPMSCFQLPWQAAGHGRARSLDPADLPQFKELLAHRESISNRFYARDEGWLLGIDEVLWTGALSHLYWVDDIVLAWEVTDDTLHVYDVVADHLPDLHNLLQASPWPFERAVLWFSPDRVAPDATPMAWPDDDVLMVRGPWPLQEPFAVPPLAAH